MYRRRKKNYKNWVTSGCIRIYRSLKVHLFVFFFFSPSYFSCSRDHVFWWNNRFVKYWKFGMTFWLSWLMYTLDKILNYNVIKAWFLASLLFSLNRIIIIARAWSLSISGEKKKKIASLHYSIIHMKIIGAQATFDRDKR